MQLPLVHGGPCTINLRSAHGGTFQSGPSGPTCHLTQCVVGDWASSTLPSSPFQTREPETNHLRRRWGSVSTSRA
jgi:hypothetical protein